MLMIETSFGAFFAGGVDVADLDLVVVDQDAIDEQLNQPPLLDTVVRSPRRTFGSPGNSM